jgi:hypothetical protein
LLQTEKLLFTVIAGALRFLISLNWTRLSFFDRKTFVFIYNSTEDQSMGAVISRMISPREIGLSFIGEGKRTILPSLPLRLKKDRG